MIYSHKAFCPRFSSVSFPLCYFSSCHQVQKQIWDEYRLDVIHKDHCFDGDLDYSSCLNKRFNDNILPETDQLIAK
jgi:hypothetical protein